MKLSRNFSLIEFQVSQTAARHDIDMSIDNPVYLANVKQLAATILQPLRDSFVGDPPSKEYSIFISSGFRPKALNRLIGGSDTSDHMTASAADIVVVGHQPIQVAERIIELELPFGQCILEFNRWIHVSIGDKREVLTARKVDGKTQYSFGLIMEA